MPQTRCASTLQAPRRSAAIGSFGQIAPACSRDFVVLDRDITACDPEEIQFAQVLVTYVGGRFAHYER